jgi:ankyrin repeat protein
MQRWDGFAAAAAAGLVLILSPASAGAGAAKPETPKPELAEAIAKQKTGKIEKLLAAGAAVDVPYQDGRTALYYAASRGDEVLVGRVLKLGAKVDARDAGGATPLIAALRSPVTKWSTVNLLLQNGAAVDATDINGRTPLMEAVLRSPQMMDTGGQIAMIEGLLAAGADPNRVDVMGAAAMHYAAAVGEPRKALELLLSKTSDPHVVTASGANVLMMAAQNRQRANVEYLLGRGFRPVRTKAVGTREPLDQDVSTRANALAADWAAQYLARKGDTASARAYYAAAIRDYEAAAEEARRMASLYEQEIAKDKADRAGSRAAAGLMSALSVAAALASGGGYYSVYSPTLSTKLEQDEHELAALNTEVTQSLARAAAIRSTLAQ